MKNLQRCHPFFRSIGVLDSDLLCHKLLCGGGSGRNKNKYLIKLVGYFTPLLYALTSKPDQPVLLLPELQECDFAGICCAIIGQVHDLQLAKKSGQDNLTGTKQGCTIDSSARFYPAFFIGQTRHAVTEPVAI